MATTTAARNIRVFVDKALSPAAISAHLASEARRLRDEAIKAGQASPAYRTFVDGTEGRSEDSAQRTITYRFSSLLQATNFALREVKARSPVDSGTYRDAWLVLVNGQIWSGRADDIPPGVTVMIVNPVPYARKIDVGGMIMSVPPQIVEGVRQRVQSEYPTVRAERDFVMLPSGLYPGAPYTLKQQGVRSGIVYSKKRGFEQKFKPELTRRRDRRAGQQITYPALIMSERR